VGPWDEFWKGAWEGTPMMERTGSRGGDCRYWEEEASKITKKKFFSLSLSLSHRDCGYNLKRGCVRGTFLTYYTPPFVYGYHQSCDFFSCIYILYPAYGWDNIVLSSFLII